MAYKYNHIEKTIEYNTKYSKENYDRLSINLYKGSKDTLKEIVSKHGQSMNDYIIQAIEERVSRDGDEWENKKMV